jgi:hypothetical protein
LVVKITLIILPMHSDKPSEPGGVCGSAPPALVPRDGRLVFTRSGRSLDDVVAALERGDADVDPDEARIALAHIERS